MSAAATGRFVEREGKLVLEGPALTGTTKAKVEATAKANTGGGLGNVPVIGPVLGAGEKAYEAVTGVPNDVEDAAKEGAEYALKEGGGAIVSAAAPYATKFGLYALLIIGGVAAVVYGLTLAIRPAAPGPSETIHKAAKAAKLAAVS